MPSIDYDAMRAARRRRDDPLTFTLGGHTFETLPSPSVGAALDLVDAPEPLGEGKTLGLRACIAFIKQMLVSDEDRAKFDGVLYELRLEDHDILYQISADLTQQYTGRPTEPSGSSSSGPPGTGSWPSPQLGGAGGPVS